MKQLKKGLFCLLILFLLFSLCSPLQAKAAAIKYAVKIENEDEIYQFYNDLIIMSPDSHIMVKAKEICDELGLVYKYNTGTKKLTITNQWDASLTFTLGSKYYYYNYPYSSDKYKEKASYQFYYDKKSKAYLIPYAVLKELVACEYYKLPKDDYYSKQGYSAIIFYTCYSYGGPNKTEIMTDDMADKIIAEVTTKDMTDVEKVKALNDYMCENCEYDDTLTRYSASDILLGGTGVCQAYMEAFHLLLTKAGIEDHMVTGTAYNGEETGPHGWNMVKLGKDYYHVDTTWNDVAGYRYFLLSDQEMSKDHFWDEKYYQKCKKGIQKDRSNIAAMVGDYFYFCDYSDDNSKFTLSRVKYDGSDSSILLELPCEPYTYFEYSFSNDSFFYGYQTENSTIYRLNLNTKQTEEFLTVINLDAGSFNFYRDELYISDGGSRIFKMKPDTKEQQLLYELVPDTTKYASEHINYMYADKSGITFYVVREAYQEWIRTEYHMKLDGSDLKEISSEVY